jgi:signal transduction histidine kinase/ligand-binding sensor domain-containing protein/CheY-like chemotaxis protein
MFLFIRFLFFRRLKYFVLFSILITQGFSNTNNQFLYFDHISNNDGLSSNHITCIYEDKEGFIWFGTDDGLNLYNGEEIIVFKNVPEDSTSLHVNVIRSIVSDPVTDNLWIGTQKGISYFDKSTYSFTRKFDKQPNPIDNNVFTLAFDNYQRLWMGTFAGLFVYDREGGNVERILKDEAPGSIVSDRISHLLFDEKYGIIISTNDGVDLLDPETKTVKHLFQKDLVKDVKSVFRDSRGVYWVCTENMGLFKADFETETLENFTDQHDLMHYSDRIHYILEDNYQNLYFLARDQGLYIYNEREGKLSLIQPDIYDQKGLNSKGIISGLFSSNDMVWLGTYNKGVNYINHNQNPFFHYKINYRSDGLVSNDIKCFFQDEEGLIWVGSKEGGGLSLFDPQKGTFENFKYKEGTNSISSDYIFTINQLNETTLLLGTFGEGIDLFDKTTKTFTNLKIRVDGDVVPENNRIYSIFKDNSGDIWVASLRTLFQFNPNDFSFTPVYNDLAVKSFVQDKNSSDLWMASKFAGLLRLSAGKLEAITVENTNGELLSNNISGLRFDGKGNLWIGTDNGLNCLYMRDQSIRSWTEQDGLSSNKISALEIDDSGQIWISTSNGISRFEPVAESFKNYFMEDGLQGNQFENYVSLKTTDGMLLFGGNNGFNIFNPDQIVDKPITPPIHFVDFKIANKSVIIGSKDSPLSKHINRTQHIDLKHNQADFTFEFVALNYNSTNRSKYRYKLVGYDQNWIETEQKPIATYTNINPGDYIFQVEVLDDLGAGISESKAVSLSIAPPPWKTSWAYTFYVFFIASLVLAMYYFITKRIEQERLLELERRERERSEQLNQMKLQFFTNISHEFRTPLTLITAPLNKLIKQTDLDVKQRKYLYTGMYKNATRLLRLIRQLMDFRKIENNKYNLRVKQGNLELVIQEIINGFDDFAKEKYIKIDYQYHIKYFGQQWFDPNVIDSVVFNLLSNAIKFSRTKSNIEVVLEVEDNSRAIIKITDHGVGIKQEKIHKIFERFYTDNHDFGDYNGTGVGLAFSQSLARLHGGEITVKSDPGIETIFTVTLPVNKEAFPTEALSEIEDISTPIKPHLGGVKIDLHQEFDEKENESRKSSRILLVEDNVELRKFLKNHLSGYQVLEANDGVEAMEIIQKTMPDLVVSDIMMPRMDGISLCKSIKSSFITSHIPVVLLTAKTAVEHKIEGIENGADAYVEKPFDLSFLEAQILNLLKQRMLLRKRFANHFDVQPSNVVVNKSDKYFFEKVEKVVLENISDYSFSVEDLGKAIGMSRCQLFRKFKALTDNTPSDFIRAERIKRAKKLLLEGELNVNEVSLEVGFNSNSHFISTFKKYTGYTPKEFSKK